LFGGKPAQYRAGLLEPGLNNGFQPAAPPFRVFPKTALADPDAETQEKAEKAENKGQNKENDDFTVGKKEFHCHPRSILLYLSVLLLGNAVLGRYNSLKMFPGVLERS
jgi:hypothetical protein